MPGPFAPLEPRGLRDDELHVLAVTAKRIIRDAVTACDCLELLAAKQGFVQVASMMRADCAGAGHSICPGRALGVALINDRSIARSPVQRNREIDPSIRADNGVLFECASGNGLAAIT